MNCPVCHTPIKSREKEARACSGKCNTLFTKHGRATKDGWVVELPKTAYHARGERHWTRRHYPQHPIDKS